MRAVPNLLTFSGDGMNIITSKSNPKIKLAYKLMNDASARRGEGLFILEGLRLCCDAALSGVLITDVFVTDSALDKYSSELEKLFAASAGVYVIREDAADRISDTKNSQGVFCVCKALDKADNIDKIKYNGMYIAMENIQTPSNLGAAARTAEALGLDGLIISGGCDIYNPKALRASMGSLLRLDVLSVPDLGAFIEHCRISGMSAYAAVPDSDAVSVTDIDKSGGVICVIGNEGNGLTARTISACTARITIPMRGRAESLNAAAAASIIMWEMVR